MASEEEEISVISMWHQWRERNINRKKKKENRRKHREREGKAGVIETINNEKKKKW